MAFTPSRGKRSSPYAPPTSSAMASDVRNATRKTPPGRGSSVASAPIHWTIFSGSVKKPNTVSGSAAILTSCSRVSVSLGVAGTGLALLLCLRGALESREPRRQHLGDEAVQVGHPLGTHAVQPARALAAFVDEARLAQHLEVLRDCRLRQGEVRDHIARRALAVRQDPQDLAPRGLGDRLEDLHKRHISMHLYKPHRNPWDCSQPATSPRKRRALRSSISKW